MNREGVREYAKLRVTVVFEPQHGSEDRDRAVDVAVEDLKEALKQVKRASGWLDVEGWELIGFERE